MPLAYCIPSPGSSKNPPFDEHNVGSRLPVIPSLSVPYCSTFARDTSPCLICHNFVLTQGVVVQLLLQGILARRKETLPSFSQEMPFIWKAWVTVSG